MRKLKKLKVKFSTPGETLFSGILILFQNGGCLRRSGSRSMRTRHRGPELEMLCSSSKAFRTAVAWSRDQDYKNNMANTLLGPLFLTDEDIPGSSFSGRKPSTLKNSELRLWLRCRGDSDLAKDCQRRHSW